MKSDDLDFDLPPELIAQQPAAERAASRLLHYRRDDRSIAHRSFADLPSLLRRGDLLVFNDARVLPARFVLTKTTGGRVEGLFLSSTGAASRRWIVMLRNAGDAVGQTLRFARDQSIEANVIESHGDGEFTIELNTNEPPESLLARIGRMPLPPYIRREKDADERDEADRVRYQTVYAQRSGAVAAPTAGLHFTPELLEQLAAAGVQKTFVTLHVGAGTFKPIKADRLEDHAMHEERYEITETAAGAINAARGDGRRIIAVGTTAARVLEHQPADEEIKPHFSSTRIFIYPPYKFRRVGAMITNFHLPRSTLIAMIAALIGLDEQRRVYAAAIKERYRFFSYGDAMLIE